MDTLSEDEAEVQPGQLDPSVGTRTVEKRPAKASSVTLADDNKFQRAVAVWRNIDLASLIPSLDTAASDLVTHQREALIQRKELAQKTKDFRKLDDAAKLAEIKTLLKAYQSFIDLLTNQSKSLSNAFLQLFTPLSEAPDPYPLLEASIDSLVTAEETVPKLTAENEHLQRTVTNLNTQLERSERLVEQERSLRQSLEQTRDESVKEVQASWSAVLQEKQDNWEAKERALEGKVEDQDRLVKELKANLEVSQRLGQGGDGTGNESGGTVTIAELEVVSSELDRTQQRLAEVEARNEQFRMELAQTASTSRSVQSVDDDPSFLRLQSENSSLLRKLEAARFEKESESRSREHELRNLEREVASLRADRDSLQKKLQRFGDYDSIKRELDVLKSIEFATRDDEETDVGRDNEAPQSERSDQNGSLNLDGKETLEQLLLTRNKKLADELTLLRVSHQEAQARLATLQEEISNANMELEKSRNLNATLENDLLRMQQEATQPFPSSAMSVAGTYTSRFPQSSMPGRRGRASPTSSILSGFDPHSSPHNNVETSRVGETGGSGSGILPMVTAQRDRFKKRNSELEAELSKTYQTVSSLRSEIASLQKDNLNLYEKTRYVSTYNRNPATTTSSSAYSSNPNPTAIQVSSDTPSGLTLDRYRSVYEQNISPFAAFRGRESARAFKRMSILERAVFQITRLVLASRTSRNIFAAYCLALHLLVFGMLYWMTTSDIEKHTTNLGNAAAAAAGPQAAHGSDWHEEGFRDSG